MNGERNRLEAIARAERFVRATAPGIEVLFDPHVQGTLGGRMAVHGRQHYRGIPVEPASFVVDLDADGARLTGDAFIDVPELDVLPRCRAAAAVRAAFEHLRGGSGRACHTAHEPLFERKRYRPRPTAVFPLPAQATVFPRGPFRDDVTASLVIHAERSTPALAWLVSMVAEDFREFTLIVDASTAELLSCAVEAASIICFANVLHFDPVEAAPVRTRFPRLPADYSAGIRPQADFGDWVDRTRQTRGNNVEMRFNNRDLRVTARPVGADDEFQPNDDRERQVVNAFFLCNFLHDFFSLAGFDEAHGNFQAVNTGGGIGNDPLVVQIFPNVMGRSNMTARKDGMPAEMRLGTIGGRAAAFDASIVIHEYAHGVSQRLVGGNKELRPLARPQSEAMGEGWSDYFAITILNSYRTAARRSFVIGPWAFGGNPRLEPYDRFTATYGDIVRDARYREQHEAGSIFAAALIAMQTDLMALLGDAAGNETGWKLVVASLKLLKANPHFLAGRQALLEAAKGLPFPNPRKNDITDVIRTAFAARGMGSGATSADASFANIREDFTV